ncbi:MAG: hypothetical protein ABSF26_27400 [Thermoguttaceae bacterium]|jgi:hypothetical protein
MVALPLALFGSGRIGSAAEADAAAAKPSASAETLEAVAQRLKKAVDADWRLSSRPAAFNSRRDVAAGLSTWYKVFVPYIVTLASPTDRVGQAPADFRGAAVVHVIATDGRYTVVAGSDYEPEIAAKILTALGMTLSKEAERDRRTNSAAHWLDFRLAVVRESSREHQALKPLAQGPTREQIEDYMKLFAEKGPNGAHHRGDPYLWLHVLDFCQLSPLFVIKDERGVPYVLLSDKPNEVLLNWSERRRAWHLKGVEATRDSQGRFAIQLKFDEVAAARMAQLATRSTASLSLWTRRGPRPCPENSTTHTASLKDWLVRRSRENGVSSIGRG